nr:MAG TPA: hypothetical protein [Bacteriophage sp.]
MAVFGHFQKTLDAHLIPFLNELDNFWTQKSDIFFIII